MRENDEHSRRGLSRRGLFGVAGLAAGGLAVGGAAGAAAGATLASTDANARYPFYGAHQSGIVTPAQDRLHFAAFDIAASCDRAGLISLLTDWSDAAARMTAGEDVGQDGATGGPLQAPPEDTGEALGLPASALTITIGFGPSLFTDADGADRFGIADRRPSALVDLPHFSGDILDPAISGGDVCIQACADDPQVAVHAIRNLSRIAFGRAALRWSQLGFGRTSSTSTSQQTPRNLFGFKDGTANVKAENGDDVQTAVWADAADGTEWMAGGSYLVTRKIRMIIETWDRASLGEQQRIIGRTKGEGAPLSGGTEFTEPDFDRTVDGAPAIDPHSHVHLAHPSVNEKAMLLRRGYNYVEGNDELGRLNAGLFFMAYQRDPRRQFIPIQRRLAANDLMNEYVRHVSSAIFAVPPGAAEGGFVGSGLFG
ncbi:deferrochelatase/peroxidase EfeB [Paramicrobacterium humi]|uniref:Deferrochelatase n=1 Tax=Paramicrobacterium humi TaxID=640635 RepID=A0A1H4T586_9MICO|nr:iron uptake transporter deferrochelatase/peroxidase subunit [Microbacterium humi]SEC51606.1 deferrochelatase/peroxidase EfeB [Microbacterium humi]